MAIAFDDGVMTNGWVSSTSNPTLSKTNTGSNLVLFVGVGTYNASLITVSGITYNGVALTKVDNITAALEGNNQDTELWYLDGPATGANTISVTLSGTASFASIAAASYTGKTSSGIDAFAKSQNTSTSSTSPACNVTISASDCWLVGFAHSRSAGFNLTAGTGTTVRASAGSIGHAIGDSNGVVGPGSTTLSFVDALTPTWPGVVSASFSAAGGAAAARPRLIGGRLVNRGLTLGGLVS